MQRERLLLIPTMKQRYFFENSIEHRDYDLLHSPESEGRKSSKDDRIIE